MKTVKPMRLVGKVKDAHGLRGDLYVLIFSGDISWLPKMKSFGLGALPDRGTEVSPEAVSATFMVASAKPFKQGLIIKAQDIADRTAAEKVRGQGFYVPADFFVSDPEEDDGIYLAEIEHFTVELENGDVVGPIIGFASNGAQDLLVVKTATGEAEIPFVEAFLVDIERDRKVVVMDLPEGLLDLSAPAEPDDE